MTASVTPMMAQYLEMKGRHPDAILLFRMGDFYEMFFDDAKAAAEVLGLTLTTRGHHLGEPIPMAGVPWHSVDAYVSRLLDAGKRVAMCDQVEDARKARGLVKRAVTEVITKGTVLPGDDYGSPEDRYLAALSVGPRVAGLAMADVTTGDLFAGEFPEERVADELQRLRPLELLVPPGFSFQPPEGLSLAVSSAPEPWPSSERAAADLARRFGTADLAGFGCAEMTEGVIAAAALLRYLTSLKGEALRHFSRIRRLDPSDELLLDAASLRHLEVIEAPARGRSLFEALDETRTAMGRRFLKRALARPSRDLSTILSRQDAVAWLVERASDRRGLAEQLAGMPDLERLGARLGTNRAGPRDLVALRSVLGRLPSLRDALSAAGGRLATLAREIDPLEELAEELAGALADEPPARAGDGGVFRPGYSEELDAIRASSAEAKAWIAGLQDRERARTGIANLRVGFHRVFGYHIEITRSNLPHVPADYQRRQTLVGSERFITEALKERESLVLGAEERFNDLELELFEALRARVVEHLPAILATARAIAEVDFFRSCAEAAVRFEYVRPHVHEGLDVSIEAGRHPVVERELSRGRFIPNDCSFDPERRQILLITGPNMAGKSTYLRQVGLIVLLAHVGSFVPARAASIGLADRIFTRVGASDNLARGQSTFLVEMNESAAILNGATSRSVVLLDEVGRGTSTFDGLSIAWAMTEYLHDGMGERPRTLFATHFHELTELGSRLSRVVNLRVEVKEWEDTVVFLHEIREGKADRSYGIHVAQMAGVPAPVIARARHILASLEAGGGAGPRVVSPEQLRFSLDGREAPPRLPEPPRESDPAEERLAERILAADLTRTTPLEALNLLSEMQEELRDRRGTDR